MGPAIDGQGFLVGERRGGCARLSKDASEVTRAAVQQFGIRFGGSETFLIALHRGWTWYQPWSSVASEIVLLLQNLAAKNVVRSPCSADE